MTMSGKHILVDGYSMLHQWDELKPARLRSLAAGREALILLLTHFHDSHGGKLTVVFDGRSVPRGGAGVKTDVGILYSREGETADAVIERMVGQSPRPHDFLIATDDHAEQNIVESLGARAISADGFHAMMEDELKNLKDFLKQLSLVNRRFSR